MSALYINSTTFFYHHLRCRAFPVTKELTRIGLNLSMQVLQLSYCDRLCFPGTLATIYSTIVIYVISISTVKSKCGFFLHKSQYMSTSRLCVSIDVHFYLCEFCVSKVPNLQKLCQTQSLKLHKPVTKKLTESKLMR